MKIKVIGVALILSSYASVGLSQVPPKKSEAQAKGRVQNPNDKLCRIEDRTGSIFTEKVCRTRREWSIVDNANDNDKERVFRMRRGFAEVPK
jgi:hypothetical protein